MSWSNLRGGRLQTGPVLAEHGLPALLDDHWRQFETDGLVRIGRLDSAELGRLRTGLDDIMLDRENAPYDRPLMQLDSSSGNYGDLGCRTKGFKGATLNYRKIQDLELVGIFPTYLEGPPFRSICRHVFDDIPIACFRAMAMIKAAGAGTKLAWHQDRWQALDRDPLAGLRPSKNPPRSLRVRECNPTVKLNRGHAN